MKLYEKELGTGIVFRAIPKTGFKTDHLLFVFRMPLARETATMYAMLPPVLGRGCEKYPTFEALTEHLDTLYNASVDCRTTLQGETQLLSFTARALETDCVPDGEDVFLETVETMAELMLRPLTEGGGFRADYVETEKNNAADAIRSRISNKELYASTRCIEEMCADEPYGASCYRAEDVLNIDAVSLYRAYTVLLAKSPAELYYVGKRDPEQLAKTLAAIFAPLSEMRCLPLWRAETSVLRYMQRPMRVCEEEQPAKQARLQIGCRSGAVLADKDYYIFALFNELYGGSPSSRLYNTVREEMGLCYECSTVCEPYKGLLFISCGIDSDRREDALNEILGQLVKIAAGNIAEEELDAAKRSLCSGYRMIEDNNTALAVWYCNRFAAGLDSSPEESAEQVRGVTKKQISSAAAGVSVDTVFFMRGTLSADDDCGEDEWEGSDDAE